MGNELGRKRVLTVVAARAALSIVLFLLLVGPSASRLTVLTSRAAVEPSGWTSSANVAGTLTPGSPRDRHRKEALTATPSAIPNPYSIPASNATRTPAQALTSSQAHVTTGTGGVAMPRGDIAGWHQVFAEDFATPVALGAFPGNLYQRKWGVYVGRHDTSGRGVYDPSRVLSVSNGVLNIYLHTENGIHLVAAPYPLLPGRGNLRGMSYGRYSIRFRADPVAGYKTAWLLWPDSNNWPADGEIDWPEGNLSGIMNAFMHYANPAGGQAAFPTRFTYQAWHTATTEWSPGNVRFLLDGQVMGVSTTQIPSNPMHLVLQTETQIGGPAPSDTAAGYVQVDWVVIYSRA